MKCCECRQRLDFTVKIKGQGICSHCGTEQAIKKVNTFIMVITLIVVLVFLPSVALVKAMLAFGISILYLFFSKTEKVSNS